ncbi:ROK family glucokinase [Fictibacillus enclensis]|uniref:ROK family glucokinase n=1 Tax=Fictibacillus enclensis TaxID=1017270 RepID=UPI0024C00880|nr:ROK family glucokinase [Fictibacillus enclensis]MDM5199700.1 ROK family glucokinase [Fictibacillus enclensis]WHY70426.1 ROK family glucokinase [Fictibacillus enclensis]
MDEKWYVGVDLGGTTIKMAFISDYGDLIKKWEIPTDISEKGKNITKDIAKSIDSVLDELGASKSRLHGIGMGAPGFIDLSRGFIYHAVNIGWVNFPLKERLEMETGLPVVVDNDANLAAVGEMWRGAGDGAKDLLCVTLGTGVGGGIVSNGKIVHGKNGMGGEIGHITAIPEGGAPCNCGKTGCIETVASATGICRLAREGLQNYPDSLLHKEEEKEGGITAKDVFDAADQKDELALYVLELVGYHLGFMLANLGCTINPGKIVLGGGVSKAGDKILDPVKRNFEKFALPLVKEGAEFAIASLGNDAGVYGGAYMAKTLHEETVM